MRVHRTLPPTAAPLHSVDILYGFAGIFFGKKYLRNIKKELGDYFAVKHVFLVSSGKAALTIILKAIKEIDSRREVIIPAYTCYSVPAAIIKAGLNVKLCDIDADTFDFNYEELKEKINKETLCVIPSHLFGIPSDLDRINRLCSEMKIFVIEDAAQAMGGRYKDKLIGTIGNVGLFSLGRGKNITSGSGGIIVTNSNQIADVINKYYSDLKYTSIIKELIELFKITLMTIFIHPLFYWLPSGLKFLKLGETNYPREISVTRLSGIKAGVLKNWRNNLIESERIREANVNYFDKYIKPIRPYLRIPLVCENTKKRNRIAFSSRQEGLGISLMYPRPINEIKEIKENFTGEEYPIAKIISERLVTIPTHHYINENDRKAILDTLTKY